MSYLVKLLSDFMKIELRQGQIEKLTYYSKIGFSFLVESGVDPGNVKNIIDQSNEVRLNNIHEIGLMVFHRENLKSQIEAAQK